MTFGSGLFSSEVENKNIKPYQLYSGGSYMVAIRELYVIQCLAKTLDNYVRSHAVILNVSRIVATWWAVR